MSQIPLADARALRDALERARRAVDDARDLAGRHRLELSGALAGELRDLADLIGRVQVTFETDLREARQRAHVPPVRTEAKKKPGAHYTVTSGNGPTAVTRVEPELT